MLLDTARLSFSRFFDWYEDRLDSLFQVQGSVVNGIGLLGQSNIVTRFNYLQALSRFYSAAVLSDLPRIDPAVHNVIHQAAEHWSVTGEVVLIRQGDVVRTVRPDYVFPIRDRFNRDRILKYLFIFPEQDPQVQNTWQNEPIAATRANVIEYDVATRTAHMAIRSYSYGTLADAPLGEAVDIGEVIFVQSGVSLYPTVETIVREISVRLNMLQLALNTTSIPIIQIERDGINDGTLRGTGSSVPLDVFQRTINNPLGLTVLPPFGGEESAKYIERAGTGLRVSLDYIRMLLGQLGVLTGVPDYVFGVQLGRPNNETERVLFAGQARVNAFRRDLEEAMRQVGIDLNFASEPFITRRERLANVMDQFREGLITLNEARNALGWSPRESAIQKPPTNVHEAVETVPGPDGSPTAS